MIVHRDSLHVLYVNMYFCTHKCTCIYNKRKDAEATGPSCNLLDTPI